MGAKGKVGLLAALHYPRYRRIWGAQLVAQVGFWMLVTARAVLVFDITGSAGALGAVYFFTFIPQLILAPLSGVMADRYDRRRLLMTTQVVAALGALLLGLLAGSGSANLANICVVSFLLGSMQTIMGPAGSALMPALVDREALSSAVTLQSTLMQASRIVGPLLAAALIPAFGVQWLFYANAASGIVIVLAWAVTRVAPVAASATEGAVAAFAKGFQTVRRAPDLWVPIVMVAVLSAIGLIYQPLGVAFATDVLADGDEDKGAIVYSIIQAALGIGAVVGVMGIDGITRRRPGTALMATSIGFSVAMILLGSTEATAVAIVASLLIGGFQFAQLTIAMNLVQHQVREEFRGRVMSIYMMAFIGLLPFTSFISGQIAESIGVGATFVGSGVLCLAFSIFGLRWRHYMRMDGPTPVKVT